MNSMYSPAQAVAFRADVEALKSFPVAILGHRRPDGDCIGSQVALTRMLRALGIAAFAVNEDPVPRVLRELVGDTPFFRAQDFEPTEHVAITVDCADDKRTGSILAARFPEIAVNIDHHISNSLYGQSNYVFPETSATAEIVARFCFDADFPLDPCTAQALYAGIATDTSQFCNRSTTVDVFGLCARLCESGADPSAMAHNVYGRESPAKLALLQRFLHSFHYYCDGRVCIGVLRSRDWAETGATIEDTEGLVNYARAVDGVEIGVLIEERGPMMKGSFRSNNPDHRVDQIAAQFNGGGHACAAGFSPNADGIDAFLPQLVDVLEDHFRKIDRANAN